MNFVKKLYQIIENKIKRKENSSYSYKLYKNPKLLNKKILEEARELILAKNKKQVVWETSDLFYFVLVFLVKRSVKLEEIDKKLKERNIIKSLKPKSRKGDRKWTQ